MEAARSTIRVNAFAVRDIVFFCAVILLNYTLLRPSPVDIAFALAMVLSLFVAQRVSSNFLTLLVLMTVSIASLYLSSLDLLGDLEIRFQVMIKAYVFVVTVIACYISSTWDEAKYETFLRVYLCSTAIASSLGIIGFFTKLELLTWDGRAKGLIDDPNMYGSFLVPGVLIALYFLQRRRNLFLILVLIVLVLGILVSFSRAAIGALIVCGAAYLLFLNRRNLVKALFLLLAGAAITMALALVGTLVFDQFAEKLTGRMTIAEPYDLGHGGRYSRYARAIPLILDNPLGIGVEQVQKYFPEPIHNITLAAFLYYGWASGCAWLLLLFFSARLTWMNFVATRSPLALLLGLNFFALVLCASLHEGEKWRHLWLSLGVLWGFNPRNTQRQLSEKRIG